MCRRAHIEVDQEVVSSRGQVVCKMAPTWLNFATRQFTVAIDINAGKPGGRVTVEEYSDWLLDELKLDPETVTHIEVHPVTRLLMVRFENEQQKQAVLPRLQAGVAWQAHGTTVRGWDSGIRVTHLKLLGVPYEADVPALQAVLSKYGKIVSWTELKLNRRFRNAKSGVIAVQLQLEAGVELPVYLPARSIGELVHVVWEDQQRTCFKCLQPGHMASGCFQQKFEMPEPSQGTWARVAAQPKQPRPRKNKSKKLQNLSRRQSGSPGEEARLEAESDVGGVGLELPHTGGVLQPVGQPSKQTGHTLEQGIQIPDGLGTSRQALEPCGQAPAASGLGRGEVEQDLEVEGRSVGASSRAPEAGLEEASGASGASGPGSSSDARKRPGSPQAALENKKQAAEGQDQSLEYASGLTDVDFSAPSNIGSWADEVEGLSFRSSETSLTTQDRFPCYQQPPPSMEVEAGSGEEDSQSGPSVREVFQPFRDTSPSQGGKSTGPSSGKQNAERRARTGKRPDQLQKVVERVKGKLSSNHGSKA